MDPAYSENVVDYRSLGNMPGYEWKLLRYKCRELRLEGVYHRHCHLVSVAVVTQLIIVIEILMLIHVILLFSVVKDIDFLNVLPYLAVMLLTPSILMPSREPNVEQYEAIAILVSCLMALLLTAMDLILPICYHRPFTLVPGYDHVVIVLVYLMFPIAFVENGRAYFLGLAVSLFYFGYMVLIDKISTLDKVWELTAYGAYLFFLNVLCMFLSRFQEYNMRNGILSRYQVVYQNLVFQLAMKEEKALLDSIIPVTLARSLQDAIASHIEEDPSNLIPFTKTRHLFMEPHPEVSILEADMVDFTSLTTTMEVSELVAILHELFVSFDLAANHNRATRIKFLGDSYTCVTGIPSYFPTHANACVNQALDMIEISREVSKRRNKKIDLRIGVHSGEILAGIIGLTKWQFDIWSKDVDITNRLESSGLPGMVHISSRTLGLLDNHYVFEKGTDTAKLDPLLQRSNLSTYLIRSRLPNFEDADDMEDDNFSLNDYRFSFSFSEDYEDIQVKAQRDMILEVEHMPVNRVQACKIRRPMHRIAKEDINEEYRFNLESYYLFTTFRSWKMEWSFSKMRDLLMKYSLGMMVFAGATIIAMDLLVKSEAMDYTMLLSLFLIILLPLLLASYKKLWLRGRRLSPITQPTFFLSRWIIKASDLIEKSVFVRIPLAIMVLFLLYVMSSETFSCDIARLELEIINSELHNLRPQMLCFMPWGVTYAVIIVLSLMLVIIGIPLIIKLGVGLAILGCHVITVHAYYGFAFERSQTTDIGVSSSLAHSWYLLAFFILVVVREGYLNYILKASYFMSMCFEKKHELTKVKTRTIKIIMANILPTHVAEVFKVRRRSDQLYYENFSQVAVMFATIENYEADKLGLRALHEMICYFDELLVNYQAWYKIEKIKVMGWTYLAACGLDVDHYTDFSVSVPVSTKRESDKLQKSGSVRFAPKDDDEIMIKDLHPTQATTNEDDNTVLVMTEFALNLLRIMRDIRSKGIFFEKDSKLTGSLKIGIAHGPAMAGVVGLSKPHYDIWGHTVNMASRMTSTGVMDGIHVTESTANVLRDFNIRCTYRGMTFVKGVGQVPTYLVDLDENLHFQQHSPDNDSHKGSKVSVHWLDEKRTER
ncbi:adenylyl cyclase X E isoform X2 [Drosophila mauritiana]|uniref:adenylate cyclase n=1 Tax=Drosophila mauritiana TaxID=7226 RepID=A0A6P8JY37_DROMA|nr:adenylyl cyclase X E isoform X2 [Drosophila mauritiana]